MRKRVEIYALSAGLFKELAILTKTLEQFGLDYRLSHIQKLEQLPESGDLVVLGSGIARFPAGRVIANETYKKTTYFNRRVVKVPLIGKSEDDDLTKAVSMVQKAAFIAAWVYSGHSLKRDIQFLVFPSKEIVERLQLLPQDETLDIDFETTGLDPVHDEIVMIQVAPCVACAEGAYVTPYGDCLPLLQWLFKCRNPIRVCNATFEQRWFIRHCGATCDAVQYDTQVDHCLLAEEEYHGLDAMAGEVDMWGYDAEMENYLKDHKCNHHEVPKPLLYSYGAGDVFVNRKLGKAFEIRLQAEPGNQLEVRKWLVRGQNTLARMMYRGVHLDAQKVLEHVAVERAKLINLDRELRDVAQRHGIQNFNVGSSAQRADLLYNKLGMRVTGVTGKDKPSTRADALEKLIGEDSNPVAQKLLDSASIKSNLEGLLERCLSAVQSGDGKMRTNFSLTKLLTGQLSSTEPPIQNITKTEVRRIWKSRYEGGYIAELDHNQLHLRIMGNLAQCAGFIDAYKHEVDLHARTTARVVLHIPESEVLRRLAAKDEKVDEARDKAKKTNFSIIFEIGNKALAKKLNCHKDEAAVIIKDWFIEYPEVKRQIERQHAFVKSNGYVISPLGRVRHLPRAWSTDRWEQLRALRQAGDFLISNSGRYITLYGMVMLDEFLVQHNFKSMVVSQVHDSVVLDIHPDEIEDVIEACGVCLVDKVSEICEEWMTPIPLKMDGFIGPNWYKKDAIKQVELFA